MAPPVALLARAAAARSLRRRGHRGHRGVLLLAAAAVASSPLGFVGCVAAIAGPAPGGNDGTLAPPASTGEGAVPHRAGVAYQQAATRCPGLDWTLLAAVGAVESDHGRTGPAELAPDTGEATPWIFGPTLDGTSGTAAIPIGPWTGWWGLTGPWTQAVGPMQFLPTTFDTHAVDADQDSIPNPHDIDDAAATAAAYLCAANDGNVHGPHDVAAVYNPGSPTYTDDLAAERQSILASLHASSGVAAGPEVSGPSVCPVAGPADFTDTWGAPRLGERTHQGVDMFAPAGTPIVAPEAGTVEHYDNDLGGLSYRLYGDSGTYYYGTHLTAYENVGAGHLPAGTVIGYAGTSGNAADTPPHLHWEIHPRGRGTPAINPTPTAEELCG